MTVPGSDATSKQRHLVAAVLLAPVDALLKPTNTRTSRGQQDWTRIKDCSPGQVRMAMMLLVSSDGTGQSRLSRGRVVLSILSCIDPVLSSEDMAPHPQLPLPPPQH